MFPPIPPQDDPPPPRQRPIFADDYDFRKPEYASQGRPSSYDADLTAAEWLVAILCSGIGCIVGIVWLIQGRPKAGKMLGVSLAFSFLWGLLRLALLASNPVQP